MPDLSKKYLYRITHADNIPHILKYGITHRNSKNMNPHYRSIGDRSIISTRDNYLLPDKSCLGDYIPFYFGPRSVMLYVIQKGYNSVKIIHPKDIVYCVLSIQKVLDAHLNFIFTDGHAINSYTQFFEEKDIHNIDQILDYTAINAKYWNDDLDKKRKKEAEFLIKEDIPNNTIVGYCTYEQKTKDMMASLGIQNSKIALKPDFYF